MCVHKRQRHGMGAFCTLLQVKSTVCNPSQQITLNCLKSHNKYSHVNVS